MSAPAILVLGAGLSGLHTAWCLRRAGLSVRVLESRNRLGGRVLSTPAEPGCAHRYDLGPAWFWPEFNPLLHAWVERLGLATFVQHSDGAAIYEAPDGSLQRLPPGWSKSQVSHRISGGMARLIDGIAAELGAGVIELDTRVEHLALTDDGVTVLTRDGQTRDSQTRHGQTHAAAHVVSTLPPRLLADVLAGAAGISPPILAAWRAVPTWMAGQAKFVAQYSHAFWRDAGWSGDVFSQRGPLGEIHDAADAHGASAALFGFFRLPPAARSACGEAALRTAALAQLQRCFGAAAAAPLRVWVQDWATEAATATAADHAPVAGHPEAPGAVLPPLWAPRLSLAGTEFAGATAGYLEGALEAAEAVLPRLRAQGLIA